MKIYYFKTPKGEYYINRDNTFMDSYIVIKLISGQYYSYVIKKVKGQTRILKPAPKIIQLLYDRRTK